MDDREINEATEAFRKLLQLHRDCDFGRIDGEIIKGRIKNLKIDRETHGIKNGEVVLKMEIVL